MRDKYYCDFATRIRGHICNTVPSGWVNPHRERHTIPQGQTSSPPKSLLTPTAKAHPNQAAINTAAETPGTTHRAQPRSPFKVDLAYKTHALLFTPRSVHRHSPPGPLPQNGAPSLLPARIPQWERRPARPIGNGWMSPASL